MHILRSAFSLNAASSSPLNNSTLLFSILFGGVEITVLLYLTAHYFLSNVGVAHYILNKGPRIIIFIIFFPEGGGAILDFHS